MEKQGLNLWPQTYLHLPTTTTTTTTIIPTAAACHFAGKGDSGLHVSNSSLTQYPILGGLLQQPLYHSTPTSLQNAQPYTPPICSSLLNHSYSSAPSSCAEKTILAIHVPIHHKFPTTHWTTMHSVMHHAKAPCSTLETVEALYEAFGTIEEHIEGSGSISFDIHWSCMRSSWYPNWYYWATSIWQVYIHLDLESDHHPFLWFKYLLPYSFWFLLLHRSSMFWLWLIVY